jgi:glycosyltransferase involved in cell wall biosynthesis
VIDILYVSFNRLAYTRESFEALIANTNWDNVDRLFVNDDGSTDGAWEYLNEAFPRVPVEVIGRYGHPGDGPVRATNWYLDQETETEIFAKIDNDFVVCPGWLNEMLDVLTQNPGLDILGFEPHVGEKIDGEARSFRDATHIGGKGLIRRACIEDRRPTPSGRNGYQGFTQWQHLHPEVSKGWVAPDLPVFGLDQLPFEPWRSLADLYEAAGWARRWSEYDRSMGYYWDWWTPVALDTDTLAEASAREIERVQEEDRVRRRIEGGTWS